MPELPEVTTTVNGLNKVLPKLKVTDVWSDYFLNTKNKRTDNIKNKKYFELFKKEIIGQKVLSAERVGKNVLIHLSKNRTVLIHMKMTGHLLFGKYIKKQTWVPIAPESLKDPYNRFIHLVFSFSNGKHLAFSDSRKFAKIFFFETDKRGEISDLALLGPDALQNTNFEIFKKQLSSKPNVKMKALLLDQSVLSGIGNIYSDEILWLSKVNPERLSKSLSFSELKLLWSSTKKILEKSINMGGDSMSDYRNIFGERGKFQNAHKAYRRTKEKCLYPKCNGIIERKIIAGRSAHFCIKHQK